MTPGVEPDPLIRRLSMAVAYIVIFGLIFYGMALQAVESLSAD
jgi:hypothetical protein